MQDLYIGVKEIANFLRLHWRTCYRHLKAGRLPAKRDSLGRWVMLKGDYLRSLRSTVGYHTSSE
jgi:excisionase family DNA binding protein